MSSINSLIHLKTDFDAVLMHIEIRHEKNDGQVF